MKLIGKKPPLLLLVLIVVGSSSSASVYCLKRPSRVVKVGAIFSFNSVIGRVAKPAMEIAVSDINRNTNILKGTTLKLIMKDANGSVFIASVGDSGLRVFKIAWKLQMMTRNYVWLATDWLSATLDTFLPHNQTSLKILEGVVGLHQHTLQSIKKQAFMSKWRKMQRNGLVDVELNVYGLYAYDAVWAVAHAIDRFLNDNKKITFSVTNELLDMKETRIKLGELKVFDGGDVLVKKLLDSNFTGLAGQVKFDADRGLVMNDYDVINIAKMEMHGIGYWSTYSGLSILAPEKLNVEQVSDSKLDQQLENIIWPGGSTEKPRGWEVADSGRPLRIAIPDRASFVQFVTKLSSSNKILGYCIDVFNEARKLVPYDVPYRFELFGDGLLNPNYDNLVKKVGDNVSKTYMHPLAIKMIQFWKYGYDAKSQNNYEVTKE